MVYQSKKDKNVTASLDFEDTKCKTTRLIYLTGDKKGKSFVVSNSTLKRWWTKVEDNDNPLNIDMEEVNKPYKPDVTPHYIPKPKSVIEYEANKNKRFNSNLPDFNVIVDEIGSNLKKVNENSKYVMFNDKSTLWRKSSYIDVYATEDLWRDLTEAGFQSKVNKDKDRPFSFRISTADEYERLMGVLKNV